MSEKSVFLAGAQRLFELDQKLLNAWVLDYFKYGFDRFFLGAISHDYPSNAISEILKAAARLKAVEFEKRLRLAIWRLLESITSFEMPEPALIYDVLLTISEHKITEAAGTMVRLIDAKNLQDYSYKGVNLHFLFLKFLPDLYQSDPPGAEDRINKEIRRVLEANISNPVYTAVCYRSLWKLDGRMGWTHLPAIVLSALQNLEIKLRDEITRFIANSTPSDLEIYFDRIFDALTQVRSKFSKEVVMWHSGEDEVDTPFKLVVKILMDQPYYTIWTPPQLGASLHSEPMKYWHYSVLVWNKLGNLEHMFTTKDIVPEEELLDSEVRPEAQGMKSLTSSSIKSKGESGTRTNGPPNDVVWRSIDRILRAREAA